MQRASTYHREMYAITQVVRKWRQYFLGRKFTIIIDQQPLKNLTEQVIQTLEQQKWISKLVGYEFDIIYRPGKNNEAVDALSRAPNAIFLALSTREFKLVSTLCSTNQEDAKLLDIQRRL